ncbi:MAG: glycosyltransferase [Georgenia sp.]
MRCVIVSPTYDEATSLPGLLAALEVPSATAQHTAIAVLVVDDNRSDRTAALVRASQGFGDWLTLLTRTSEDGLGTAYRAGVVAAIAHGYDAAVQIGADGPHPVAAVSAMLALLLMHDLVLGSWDVRGGATETWPLRRPLLQQVLPSCATFHARCLLGLSTRDTTSGFRALHSEALVAVGVLHTASNGDGFQVQNTWRSERLGLPVAEHPITFPERTAGASTMSPEAAAHVLRWRIREITHRTNAPVRIP